MKVIKTINIIICLFSPFCPPIPETKVSMMFFGLSDTLPGHTFKMAVSNRRLHVINVNISYSLMRRLLLKIHRIKHYGKVQLLFLHSECNTFNEIYILGIYCITYIKTYYCMSKMFKNIYFKLIIFLPQCFIKYNLIQTSC